MEFLETIGILDLVFSVILVVSVLLGLMRGAVREVLSLVGLALAVFLAVTYSELLSTQYLSRFFEQPKISYLVTFVFIILCTIFFMALVNMFISQLLRASGLSFLNRLLGVVFGTVRGAVICSILVMVLAFIPSIIQEPWWKASAMVPIFERATKVVSEYLPEDVTHYIDDTKITVGDKVNQVVSSQTHALKQQGVDTLGEKLKDIDQTSKILESISAGELPKSTIIELESMDKVPSKAASQNSDQNNNKSSMTLESYQ